jgi:hypothetical protein
MISNESVYERRRREPLYFEMRASNAIRAARLLESAVTDAFFREASLALELIAKAVIAQRLQVGEDLGDVTKVPANHNVPQLWTHARLPSLSREDSGRLVQARVFLMWAARYPAPNRDADGDRDAAELWEVAYDKGPAGSLFRTPHTFNWNDIDRIYSLAHNCFFHIRVAYGLSQRDGDTVWV